MKSIVVTVLVSSFLLGLAGCSSDVKNVQIKFILDRPLSNSGESLNDTLKKFIFYEQSEDVVWFSNVFIERRDLNTIDTILIESTAFNSFRKFVNVYDKDNRKVDYDEGLDQLKQPLSLSKKAEGVHMVIPVELAKNQLVISPDKDNDFNYFRDLEKLKSRIKYIVDSTEFAVMDFEIFFERQQGNVLAGAAEQETISVPPINQVPATNVKTISPSKESGRVESTPREAVYNVNLASQNWSNKVTWKKIPNAEKIVISVREKNGNPKAYNKSFEVFAGGEVFSIPPGRGIDATFLYNIELKAFDKDGNEMKLLNNRISEVNIDCNN